MELHRKEKERGKEREALLANLNDQTSKLSLSFWKTCGPHYSTPFLKDHQLWAAAPPTQVSTLPFSTATSCPCTHEKIGDKSKLQIKST